MEAKQYSSRRSGQRIPMVMISNMAARHVCFTKRRRGLFKKVCELSTLCGTDLLALVTSTAGKLYSIGTPDVPVAVERFLHMHTGEDAASEQPPASREDGPDRLLLEKLFEEMGALERALEELRKLRALLQRSTEEKAGRLPRQWVEMLGELPTHELDETMASLKELLGKVGFAEAAALNHQISSSATPGGEALRETAAGSYVNVVRPGRYHSTLLPHLYGSRLAASVGSSAFSAAGNLLGQAAANYWSANPSTVPVPPPPPCAPPSRTPSSMRYAGAAAVLIAPSTAPVNRPSGFGLFPPINASDMTDPSLVAMASSVNHAPPSSGLLINYINAASGNLPAISSYPPATPRPPLLNMSSFAPAYSAMHRCYPLPSHNPSSISTSAAAPPHPRHTNPGGGMAPRPTGHDVSWPPAAVAAVPRCVGNRNTAPEAVGQIVISATGGQRGLMGDTSPPSSWGFFDIPRDFDFGRDWSV